MTSPEQFIPKEALDKNKGKQPTPRYTTEQVKKAKAGEEPEAVEQMIKLSDWDLNKKIAKAAREKIDESHPKIDSINQAIFDLENVDPANEANADEITGAVTTLLDTGSMTSEDLVELKQIKTTREIIAKTDEAIQKAVVRRKQIAKTDEAIQKAVDEKHRRKAEETKKRIGDLFEETAPLTTATKKDRAAELAQEVATEEPTEEAPAALDSEEEIKKSLEPKSDYEETTLQEHRWLQAGTEDIAELEAEQNISEAAAKKPFLTKVADSATNAVYYGPQKIWGGIKNIFRRGKKKR